MPADKTPGEVAYIAHAYALVKETGIGTNTWWSSLPEHEVKVWEKTAKAVREQLQAEQKESNDAFRKLKYLFHPTPIEALIEIQELFVGFKALPVPADRDHNEEDKDDLINAIGRLLASPTPEAAEACAEDAAAGPSRWRSTSER